MLGCFRIWGWGLNCENVKKKIFYSIAISGENMSPNMDKFINATA